MGFDGYNDILSSETAGYHRPDREIYPGQRGSYSTNVPIQTMTFEIWKKNQTGVCYLIYSNMG